MVTLLLIRQGCAALLIPSPPLLLPTYCHLLRLLSCLHPFPLLLPPMALTIANIVFFHKKVLILEFISFISWCWNSFRRNCTNLQALASLLEGNHASQFLFLQAYLLLIFHSLSTFLGDRHPSCTWARLVPYFWTTTTQVALLSIRPHISVFMNFIYHTYLIFMDYNKWVICF